MIELSPTSGLIGCGVATAGTSWMGATAVEMVQLDSADLTFEVRYAFPNEATFRHYETHYAPRLREEGLARFPTSRGVRYARTTGSVIDSI